MQCPLRHRFKMRSYSSTFFLLLLWKRVDGVGGQKKRRREGESAICVAAGSIAGRASLNIQERERERAKLFSRWTEDRGWAKKSGKSDHQKKRRKKKVSPASPPSINVPPNQSSAGYQRERRRGTRASTIGRGWNLLHVNLGRSYRLLTVIQLFLFSSVPPRV